VASKWNDPIHNFYEHVEKTDTCWLWTGCLDKDGYGVASIKQKKLAAHRAAYILFVGEIPADMYVLHGCNNTSCVNPEHLRLGTQQDNINDQIAAGTNVAVNKNYAILDWNLVSYIRSSTKTCRELATELGVSYYCIWDVIHKRSWTDEN